MMISSNELRKALIEEFYRPARTRFDLIVKRKLGIFTDDVRLVANDFDRIPTIEFDDEKSIEETNLLTTFRHHCLNCPSKFLLTDEFHQRISTSWSRVYLCDICHCTRVLEEKMIRHLKSEGHLSASEYLSDSATMTLHQCVRRSCLKLTKATDSIIICPICDEIFSTVNVCAMHSFLCHSLDFIYSIGFVCQTFDDLLQHSDLKQTKRTISFYLCSFNECFYRTKDLSDLKIHLMSKHSIDTTINVKINEFYRPTTYFHITRFHQKNHFDIQDEIETLEQLENEIKYRSNSVSIIPLIKTRLDLLRSNDYKQ